MIIGELAVIVTLSVSLYATYLGNVYFQTYVNSLSPILVPILSVAFGISSASIATYLYLGTKSIRRSHEPELALKKRVHPRKPAKHPLQPSPPSPKVAELVPTTPAKLKPIAPPQSHVQTQKPPLKERESPPVTKREKPDT